MQNNGHTPLGYSKSRILGSIGKPVCEFLRVNNSKLLHILHRLRDMTDYFRPQQRLSLSNALVGDEPLNSEGEIWFRETGNIPLSCGVKCRPISIS